jgi:hypothetical protein
MCSASDPYLRIMMFSQSGRLVKKKKTTVKVNTNDPVFNETLNFEVMVVFACCLFVTEYFSDQVAPGQLDNSRFLVTLWNRRQAMDMAVMEDMKDAVNNDSSDQEGNGQAGYSSGM